MSKTYLDLTQYKGYPVGEGIFYECGICGESVYSAAEHGAMCSCRNIIIDTDAARVAIKDPSKFSIYREE